MGMSVMHLRRDRATEEEPVVEIETPFPLRKLEVATNDADVVETQVVVEPAKSKKSLSKRIAGWTRMALGLGVLSAAPILMAMSADVGDRDMEARIDRTQWSSPMAGSAATLIDLHYNDLGWASDAPSWTPMGWLTAKPAYQSSMAEALGEYVNLVSRQAAAAGTPDSDLEATARLLTASSTGIQMRAARDALVSYDGRMRRHSGEGQGTQENLFARLALIQTWTARSEGELIRTTDLIGGNPLDEVATTAVYAAKARAQVAYLFIESLPWPQEQKATNARAEALAAWKAAAEFHPVVVMNGSPDGAVFGNHAASMGFLLSRAKTATDNYMAYFAPTPPTMANAQDTSASDTVILRR